MKSETSFRVVRIYTRYPPKPGGMEQHIARLSDGQRAAGIPVLNVYNSGDAGIHGVQIWPSWDLSDRRPAALYNAIFYLGILLQFRRLRSDDATVLHVHGSWSDFLFSKLIALLISADLVVASVHDVLKPDSQRLNRWLLSHCKLVFSTGRRERDFLAGILKCEVHHTPSAPADVFLHTQLQAKKVVDVICVTNLVEKKLLPLVLACAARRRDWTFAIYGDGPLRQVLEAEIASNSLDNVLIAGRAAPSEVASALARARIFLSTARVEGTPTSLLEAMAVGLPVVASPSNDYTWLIEEGANGYVTPGWSVDDFLQRLSALDDPALAESMSRANRTKMRGYSWSALATRITGHMKALLARQAT